MEEEAEAGRWLGCRHRCARFTPPTRVGGCGGQRGPGCSYGVVDKAPGLSPSYCASLHMHAHAVPRPVEPPVHPMSHLTPPHPPTGLVGPASLRPLMPDRLPLLEVRERVVCVCVYAWQCVRVLPCTVTATYGMSGAGGDEPLAAPPPHLFSTSPPPIPSGVGPVRQRGAVRARHAGGPVRHGGGGGGRGSSSRGSSSRGRRGRRGPAGAVPHKHATAKGVRGAARWEETRSGAARGEWGSGQWADCCAACEAVRPPSLRHADLLSSCDTAPAASPLALTPPYAPAPPPPAAPGLLPRFPTCAASWCRACAA